MGFDPALELFMQWFDRVECAIDFHWLGGKRVNANSLSPASEAVGDGVVFEPPFAQEGIARASISCLAAA